MTQGGPVCRTPHTFKKENYPPPSQDTRAVPPRSHLRQRRQDVVQRVGTDRRRSGGYTGSGLPPSNPRGRNTRYEAQPSPASRGVGAAGPAGHILERTGAPELWKRRRPPSPPSRGRPNQGYHSLPEEAQPGTVPGHRRDTPRASQLAPGEYCEGGTPSLRRTPPTPTPTNTQLRKYRSARWVPRSAGTRRYAPAEPSGSWTRRGNPGGIWSGMRPAPYANPAGHTD